MRWLIWRLPEDRAIVISAALYGVLFPAAIAFAARSEGRRSSFVTAVLLVLVAVSLLGMPAILVLSAKGYRLRCQWRQRVYATGPIGGVIHPGPTNAPFVFVGEPAELFEILDRLLSLRQWRTWISDSGAVSLFNPLLGGAAGNFVSSLLSGDSWLGIAAATTFGAGIPAWIGSWASEDFTEAEGALVDIVTTECTNVGRQAAGGNF